MRKIALTIFNYFAVLAVSLGNDPRVLHSSKGYWVVEEYVQPKSVQIIKYYSPQHELIRQDTVKGKRLDLKSRRCVVRLNRSVK